MRRAGNCARQVAGGRIGIHMEGLLGREPARSQAPGIVPAFSANPGAAWGSGALRPMRWPLMRSPGWENLRERVSEGAGDGRVVKAEPRCETGDLAERVNADGDHVFVPVEKSAWGHTTAVPAK